MTGPDDFRRGLLALDRYLLDFDDAALVQSITFFRRSTRSDPTRPEHWSALGFALDAADRPDEAMDAFQRARLIDADSEQVSVFVATLLSESGREREARSELVVLADRFDVDLASLSKELAEAGMPVDSRSLLQNGFIRARSFMRSDLQTAIERVEKFLDPAEWDRRRDREVRECLDAQRALGESFDAAGLPEDFRDLAPWVERLGVGDDLCRSLLWESVTREERATLATMIQLHGGSIHEWLDQFGAEALPGPAAACMYLLLGWEECAAGDA